MDVITIDFETYYDKEYSLKKMTTEAYIRNPLFQIIGVGVKINDGPTDWYSGSNPKKFLSSIDYSKCAVLCHNTAFDGAILSWHCGIKPKFWLDTLSMARPLHNVTVGGSLAALATYYELGKKGDEVVHAEGKRREDFTDDEMERYARYCINDVDLTYALFQKLKRQIPLSELMVIDQTIRMYTEPCIQLDTVILKDHLLDIRRKKQDLLLSISSNLDDALSTLMSNDKFAEILQQHGVEPPKKISARTGKETWAFAKTDKGMTDLLDHPDEYVQALVGARLGVKSTIEETRTQAFIDISERGALPIMLNYYGAHTGRFSGGDKINLQNLPSRGNNKIRQALKAPQYSKIIACDSSQIEARLVAWLAGQEDLVQAFREKRDVYSEFASEVYGRTITKADKIERFVGKTCIAEGTLVLCRQGWKPIETVTTDDELWDGEEWVCHHGLLYNGIKPTLNLCGIWLTPDHLLWSGTWQRADYLQQDADTLSRALGIAAENLPLEATWLGQEELGRLSFAAIAIQQNTKWITTILKTLNPLAAISALKKPHGQKDIGNTLKQWPTISTELAYSTGWQQQLDGAIRHRIPDTFIMGSAAYKFLMSGDKIKRRSSSTFKLWKGGITQLLKWTGSTWTGIMNRTTSGSYRVAKTHTTNEKSLTLKPVYDILNSGSRNRFTVLTDRGPIIVHNCVLGLGYGMGAEKFRRTLEIGQAGVSVKIDINEAERIVRLYRQKNWKIVELWQRCGYALQGMVSGGNGCINKNINYDASGIILPNKLKIVYPALRAKSNGFEYVADARAYRKYLTNKLQGGPVQQVEWTKIYGGKVVENIVQALAALVIREQMATVGQKYKVAFQVHDEIIIVVGNADADHAQRYLEEVMSTPPKWASDLPVACESGQAANYGDT